jgi:hypothetical protein
MLVTVSGLTHSNTTHRWTRSQNTHGTVEQF